MLKVPLKSVLILAGTGRDAGKREQHTVKPRRDPRVQATRWQISISGRRKGRRLSHQPSRHSEREPAGQMAPSKLDGILCSPLSSPLSLSLCLRWYIGREGRGQSIRTQEQQRKGLKGSESSFIESNLLRLKICFKWRFFGPWSKIPGHTVDRPTKGRHCSQKSQLLTRRRLPLKFTVTQGSTKEAR